MPLIASLRSLDHLLNRFDQLSQRHVQFIEHFDENFTDVVNPLRQVQRKGEEQQQTQDKLSLPLASDEEDRPRTVADFHRSVKISRYLHRPPSYASNQDRPSSRTSTLTTVSAPLPQTIRETSSNALRSLPSKARWTNPVHHAPVTPDPPPPPPRRRYGRAPITFFSMETANRLSKPRVYHHLPIKRVPPTKRADVKPGKISVPPAKTARPAVHLSTPTTISLKFPSSPSRVKLKSSFFSSHRVR